MDEKPKLWVEEMCRLLAEVERETLDVLGPEKGGFFVDVANDCITINHAVLGAYPGPQEQQSAHRNSPVLRRGPVISLRPAGTASIPSGTSPESTGWPARPS
jgi:hypothetical protein